MLWQQMLPLICPFTSWTPLWMLSTWTSATWATISRHTPCCTYTVLHADMSIAVVCFVNRYSQHVCGCLVLCSCLGVVLEWGANLNGMGCSLLTGFVPHYWIQGQHPHAVGITCNASFICFTARISIKNPYCWDAQDKLLLRGKGLPCMF